MLYLKGEERRRGGERILARTEGEKLFESGIEDEALLRPREGHVEDVRLFVQFLLSSP